MVLNTLIITEDIGYLSFKFKANLVFWSALSLLIFVSLFVLLQFSPNNLENSLHSATNQQFLWQLTLLTIAWVCFILSAFFTFQVIEFDRHNKSIVLYYGFIKIKEYKLTHNSTFSFTEYSSIFKNSLNTYQFFLVENDKKIKLTPKFLSNMVELEPVLDKLEVFFEN